MLLTILNANFNAKNEEFIIVSIEHPMLGHPLKNCLFGIFNSGGGIFFFFQIRSFLVKIDKKKKKSQ